MKITVKTTQQKIFHASVFLFLTVLVLIRVQVDIDPEKTVGDLKAKIEEDHGHSVAAQRIIFSGPSLFFPFSSFV